MANFSDNLNKTIAKGVNVFGQARALAGALGMLEGPAERNSLSKQVVSELRLNGIARPTYAYAVITPPEALRSRMSAKQSNGIKGHAFLTYRNDSFATPGIGLTTTDIRRYGYGPTEKKPNGVVYQDITFNYILDTEHNQHKFFYDWLDLIVSHSKGPGESKGNNFRDMQSYEVGYKNSYAVPIDIFAFDERFEKASSIGRTWTILTGAYPTAIGDIQYNWSGVDSLIRLPVTFTYQYWRHHEHYGNNITGDLNLSGGPQAGLFGNLLKVGTAIQALSTIRSPRNIQDVVNLVNVTKTIR